jgi:hypothetical protein
MSASTGDQFFEMWDRLVPESGQAATVQGEVVRAAGRLADEMLANGCCNWDDGFERLSMFALTRLTDGTLDANIASRVRADIEHIQAYGRGQGVRDYDLDGAIDRLQAAAVEWCRRHPVAVPHIHDADLKR